jgi:Na+-driven multidrug efflux pump
MTIDAPLDAPPTNLAANSLVTSPILPTLLRLALPNAVAMFGSTLVVAETSYIGRLGIEPLAGIALVFPFVMLTQMISAGAMGGGVSSAISRALGAGNRDRAPTLALHAAIIGVCGGIFFTVMMLLFGRQLFSLLGGRGGVLEQACNYSGVLPAIPASPPRPIPISPSPVRRSDSSEWGVASISLRKVLRKSEVRCWREPSDC